MLTCSAASMVRRWQSAGPHRCVRRVLLWGVKVWRSITLIIPVGMRRTATKDIVREDAQLLYGFGTAPERAAFRELIKISGVGPRTALSILSGLGVQDL